MNPILESVVSKVGAERAAAILVEHLIENAWHGGFNESHRKGADARDLFEKWRMNLAKHAAEDNAVA